MWETSLLQNWPLQIRLVLVRNEWVLGVFRRVLRRLLRHSRGRWLVAGVLARVVHGRRVGEGTAWGQWGRVRVFLRVRGLVVVEGPLRVPSATGPSRASGQASRERGNGEGSKRACDVGCVVACRRPALPWWWRLSALRQAQGERSLSAWPGSLAFSGMAVLSLAAISTGSGRTETRIAPTVFVGEIRVVGYGSDYTTGLTPPSMFMAVPVMKLARSEARKVMRLAASSDSPTRPRGTFLPISA